MRKLVISLFLALLLVTSMIAAPTMALMVVDDTSSDDGALLDDQDLVLGDTSVDPNFDVEVIPDDEPVTGDEVTLQEGVLPDFPMPDKLYARVSDIDGNQALSVFFEPDPEIRALYYKYTLDNDAFMAEYGMDTFIGLGIQVDLSIGTPNAWQYDESWDEFYQPSGELPKFLSLTASALEYYTLWDLANNDTFTAFSELAEGSVTGEENGYLDTSIHKFQTADTTFYVRIRYYMEYLVEDPEEGEVSRYKISEWSEPAAVGKDAPEENTLAMPEVIEPPVISNLSMIRTSMDSDASSYYCFDISVPKSTIDAEKYLRYTSDSGINKLLAEYKVGSGDWQECEIRDSEQPLTGLEKSIITSTMLDAFKTTDEVSVRVAYQYSLDNDTDQTAWSNEISCIPAEFNVPDPTESVDIEEPTPTDPIEESTAPSEAPSEAESAQEGDAQPGGMDITTIGAVAAIVVLLVVFVLVNQKKKCPGCGEKVSKKTEVCPKCGHVFEKKKGKKDDGNNGTGTPAAPEAQQPQQQQDYYQNGYYDQNGNYYDQNGYYQQGGYDNNAYYDNNAGYSDMVYCPNCGAANQPGTPYCNTCGTQLQ